MDCVGRNGPRVRTLLRRLLKNSNLRVLLLGWVALRAWRKRWWLRGMTDTLASALISFRWLPFRRELIKRSSSQEYCVWWPRHGTTESATRCWVLVPGGMSSGRDFYITSLAKSAAIVPDEAWVVFHNPGQGGSRCGADSLDPEHLGLCRTDCLAHFLERIRDRFQQIVVVGFSAGGMAVTAMAQCERPVADAFVAVCSPDKIRLVFEEQSRWLLRLDIFFSIWFHFCAREAGLVQLVPFKRVPLPPTWAGYMRPFTEKTFQVATGSYRSFEDLEEQYFDGSLKCPTAVPYLRIVCPHDPIVPTKTLEHERLQHAEVWWEPRGGHCGQFSMSRDCADRLRAWVLGCDSRRAT